MPKEMLNLEALAAVEDSANILTSAHATLIEMSNSIGTALVHLDVEESSDEIMAKLEESAIAIESVVSELRKIVEALKEDAEDEE